MADETKRRKPETARKRTGIPIPPGGLRTNEDEARGLEQTLLLRMEELLASAGVNAQITPRGLYDLFLLSLDKASERGKRKALQQ